MTNTAIAFGGNLGDVESTFKEAVRLLGEGGFEVFKISSLLNNKAVGCITGTPDFKNGVIIGKWSGKAKELISLCQKIEITLGRPREHQSNMSRAIDLDIIIFGSEIIKTENLTIPHPRAQSRDFVLIPLSLMAQDWVFPDTKLTVEEALKKLRQNFFFLER